MTDPISKQPVDHEFKIQSLDLLDQSMIKVRNCFRQLSEDQIWWTPFSSSNSIGNLVLHCCGNLRQWGVNGVLQIPDDRQRDGEFSTANHNKKTELLELCDMTIDDARQAINQLTESELMSTRHIQGFDVTVLQAVLHTTTHFVGHTHQIVLLARQQLKDRYEFSWQPGSDQDSLPI